MGIGSSIILAAWIGCQAADFVSTERALNRSNQLREGNPFLQTKSRRIGFKLTINTAAMMVWFKTPSGKGKAILPIALAGAGCGAALYNSQQGR